ncbi:DUF2270 domain-containing protein [Haloarchaeobius iranensis]|uniref:Uncharacterized membrane protein n=1 Tax=Haloarchaeobius iranensis TaxID=996166 RepID=A0A1G9ZLT3_9EURY|nr:DUF2270 domain-containing protein [Haloarchaeobius iranensis]SDN22075.1 Uncharacterized membrane protein [Haloarchaeobius iranensis]
MTQDSPEERTQQAETDSQAAPDPLVGEGLLDEEMGPSSSMAHLYRGEIHRMKFWRERLDRTTNWAVVVISALLTWSFSSTGTPHYVILIGIATLTVFLIVEARRYRGYDIWRTRVRSLQQNVFAKGLDPSLELRNPDWRRELASDYRQPTLKITTEEAIAHRLRRIYLPLFGLLFVAWVVRITAFATDSWLATARVGAIPGTVVTLTVAAFYVAALVVAFRPRTWHARGELRFEDLRR